MSETELLEDVQKEHQTEGGNRSKKEKRIDYQNIDIKVKDGQEKESKKDTFTVYNLSNNIVEIDLGRDKSVRLDPFEQSQISRDFLGHPNLELLKGIIKIID